MWKNIFVVVLAAIIFLSGIPVDNYKIRSTIVNGKTTSFELGKKYKLKVVPFNTVNGWKEKGPSKTVTVKI